MAIKDAATPAAWEDDEVPVPASVIHRDRWNRPEIPLQSDPGGAPVPRTRSSSFGKYLEDTEGLRKWGEGIVAVGVGRSRSLQLEAAALGTQDPESKETKAALRKLREHAYEGGGGNEGWRKGTALHRLTEVLDAGDDPGDQGEFNVVLDRYRELTESFEVVCSEVFGANDRWLTAGTFDFLLRLRGHLATPTGEILPPGTVLGGDKKTSGSSEYFGCKFAVQMTTYFTGEPIDKATGQWTTWEALGGRPDPRWGLILHLPSDPRRYDGRQKAIHTPGWHWVDLSAGAQLCDLSASIRSAMKTKPIVPARLPTMQHPDVARRAACVVKIGGAQSVAALKMVARSYASIWDDELRALARAKADEIEDARGVAV